MYNSGWVYEGQFKEGMYEGHGVITRIDGMSYNGQFLCGEKHGKGVYKAKNGSPIYEGTWWYGWKHGPGVYVYTDGRKVATKYWFNWNLRQLVLFFSLIVVVISIFIN